MTYTDAFQNSVSVLSDLTLCTQSWMSLTLGSSGLVNNEGQWWIVGDSAFSLFNTIVPPNSNIYKWGSCRSGCAGCSPDGSAYTNASSNHSGGCNVMMGDGSVRFVKSTVAQYTYWSLGTRAGNEAISANAY